MDKTYLFNNYKVDNNKLLEYGFIKENNTYIYNYIFDDKIIKIYIDNKIIIKVYDTDTSLEYLPFNFKEIIGSYNAMLHEKVDKIFDDIVYKCFITNNIKTEIINYALENLECTIDRPFKEESLVLRKNGKWFGLFMNIPYKSLGIESNEKVDIINIKTNNIKVDNIHYFNAYHMNKEKWMTIVLDNKTNIEELKKYINESYNLIK